MAIYLTEMSAWLRNAGLNVIEYDGWQNRARGSGGYSDYPLCVMWHHTASPPSWDGQKDADYCAVGDEDAPVSNLYIDRSGVVWILAAGATNTNGKGKSISFSRGTVPSDCMNTHAVGVEMGNDGLGERWPIAQINSAFVVSNTLNAHMGNQPDDISTHQFYAPDRKIDPATTNVEGPWQPESCTSSGSWSRGSVQAECRARAGQMPPPPQEDDEEMIFDGLWKRDNDETIFAIYKNGTKVWITDEGHLNGMKNLQAINHAPAQSIEVQTMTDPGLFAAFGVVVGPVPPGLDAWGNRP
jgi:hypothetical protein